MLTPPTGNALARTRRAAARAGRVQLPHRTWPWTARAGSTSAIRSTSACSSSPRTSSSTVQIGRKGDMPGYFTPAQGHRGRRDDHLYVVDAQFEAVQIFDADGELLLDFGQKGTGPGEFWLPAGIFIDPTNRIWIADSYNRRVQVFDYLPEGHAMSTPPDRSSLRCCRARGLRRAACRAAERASSTARTTCRPPGPAPIRATTEQEVCIFCHTPHNAAPGPAAVEPQRARQRLHGLHQQLAARRSRPADRLVQAVSLLPRRHDRAGQRALARRSRSTWPAASRRCRRARPTWAPICRDDHPISFRYDTALVAQEPEAEEPRRACRGRCKLDRQPGAAVHELPRRPQQPVRQVPGDGQHATRSSATPATRSGTTTVTDHLQLRSRATSRTPRPAGRTCSRQTTVTETCLVCHSGTRDRAGAEHRRRT